MTHSEQEEILRRALHAVADTIEPAADGLERIRERLSKPRPLAVAWLLAGWTGLAQPLLLRMEPVLAGAAGRLSDRLAEWLRLTVRSLGAVAERLRPAGTRLRTLGERLRPAGVRLHLWVERLRPVGGLLVDAIRMLRPGSGMSRHEKLRAALAFGAAVLIGAAGGFAFSDGLPQQMFSHVISAANQAFSSGQSNQASGGKSSSHVAGNGGHFVPGSSPAPGSVHKQVSTPSPACSATPKPSPDPTPTQTSRPTPTQTVSPTATQTISPTPTQTVSPTPTQTVSSSPAGPGSSPAINASAGVGTGVPTSSATPQSSRAANDGSIGPGPLATPTPLIGVNPKPAPSPATSGCS